MNIGQHADARNNKDERAVIYARTNVDGLGRSLQDQVDQCRVEAHSRGIRVVDVATDANLFGDLRTVRPGWDRVVELIEAGAVDLVLCTDISRITRRWDDMRTLMALHQAHNVDFLTLQTIVRYADSHLEGVDDGPASSPAS